MRLFQTGVFYLSQCPKLSAEWLNDRDTVSQLRNAGVLISTVAQMQLGERHPALYIPDKSIYDYDVTAWLHASAFNICWMIEYYAALSDKNVRLFRYKPNNWEFLRALKASVVAFDKNDTDNDDWLPLIPAQARDEYRIEIKRYRCRSYQTPLHLLSMRVGIPSC